MSTKFKCLAALLLSILSLQLSVCAQNSAFTYQGRFTDNGTPFTGTAEMQFTLWNAASNGTQVAATAPPSTFVVVSNGLFTAFIDFGAAQFTGADRWIQIDARTVIGPFTTLQPRQKVTSTPYAIRAANFDGTLASNQLAGAYGNTVTFSNAGNLFVGTFAGGGAGLTNINAGTLSGFTANQFWKTSGNAGTVGGSNFVGTIDNQPFEVKVNGQRVARWERQTNIAGFGVLPNVIAGFEGNSVSNGMVGATIAGGGGLEWFGPTPPHVVSAEFGTIGGGVGNIVNGRVSTIAGGERGTIGTNAFTYNSFIGGGAWNSVDGADAAIVGGRFNVIQAGGYAATIGGGIQNTNNGSYATIPGGSQNAAAGIYSFAAGNRAKANHQGSFVWADSAASDFSSTAANQFSVRANGGVRFVTAGAGMTLDGSALARLDASQTFSGALNTFGDIALENASAGYHHLQLSGGNALGYLYGSFPKWGDGIHLGYNYYADAGGGNHVSNPGGGTSRLTVGYGEIVLAVGGVNTAPGTMMLRVNTGGVCANGAIANCSDRNVKQDFARINPRDILEKVIQLPLSAWSYTNTPAVRHVGPMAQDFHAAFNVGADDKHIATIDESGVALAAIQGLNEKLERQRAENAELKRELAELKKLVGTFMGQH